MKDFRTPKSQRKKENKNTNFEQKKTNENKIKQNRQKKNTFFILEKF